MKVILFVALALLLTYARAAEPETLSTEILWRKYRSELFNFLRSGDSNALPGLQLVTTPFPAEWDRDPEGFQQVVTAMPKWSPSWELTNRDFRDAYEDFLTNLKIPPAGRVSSRLEQMEDNLFELEMRESREMMRCLTRYQEYQEKFKIYQQINREIQPKPFETYKQIYCSFLSRAEDATISARGEVYRVQVEERDEYHDARSALGKFASTPAFDRTFDAAASISRFVENAEMGNVNGFEVKITSKTSVSERNHVTQSMGVGFNGQFFGVPVSASINMGKEEMKFKTSTNDFQLMFGAKGYLRIPVFPSRKWYNANVVSRYSKGPFRTQKTYFYDLKRSIFPANAIMPVVVKSVFVAVGPRVEMYVSKDDAEQIEKKKTFGLNFSVAGFEFNFNKGSTMNKETAFNALSRITITGDSNTPQILAVETEILGQ